MPEIDLVVTDLDRTLCDAEERIHEHSLAALAELERRRLPVLVATGRHVGVTAELLGRHGLVVPVVALEGALGRDFPNGRTFHRIAFEPANAAGILSAFRAEGLEPLLCVDLPAAEYVVGDAPSLKAEHLRKVDHWVDRQRLEETVERHPVYAFVAYAGREPLERVAAAGRDLGAARINDPALFGGAALSLRPADATKWEGVVAYCAWRGLRSDRVLAVGDSENDLELLRGAAIGCVVDEGCEEALDLAHRVIPGAGRGGWSKIVELV